MKRRMPLLPIAHLGRNVPAKYVGECEWCGSAVTARLSMIGDSAYIPPPQLTVNCQCQQPPPSVEMVYDGATE